MTDVLDDSGLQRILAVMAHPDDVDFGCAGSVAGWTDQGIEVVYLMVTDGDAAWLLTDPAPGPVADAMPSDRSAAWQALDVSVAHTLLIRGLWGLEDNEEIVEFHHDVPAAVNAAKASGGTALLLNPTPVADVVAVAAAGDRMPRKSTLFVPKPATGLLIRAFEDAD